MKRVAFLLLFVFALQYLHATEHAFESVSHSTCEYCLVCDQIFLLDNAQNMLGYFVNPLIKTISPKEEVCLKYNLLLTKHRGPPFV